MKSDINVGVIEGFFGKPWDWSAPQSGIDFLRDYGYQFYVYAPKADPFLRRRWREPMPAQTMQQLSELSSLCLDQDISLGIGLTPFEIYLNYDADTKMALRSKVLQLNEIRADMLCILFDDMRGDVDELPALQVSESRGRSFQAARAPRNADGLGGSGSQIFGTGHIGSSKECRDRVWSVRVDAGASGLRFAKLGG